MTIYFDGLHLATDGDINELHAFAQKIGLLRAWFQRPDDHPHYDVWGYMADQAIKYGAKQVESQILIEKCYPGRIEKLKRAMRRKLTA